MSRSFVLILAFSALSTMLSAQASPPTLTAWFLRATAYNTAATYTPMTEPDYMGGRTLKTMICGGWSKPQPVFNGVWQLWRYDRKHRIALAVGSTDQCSAALFAVRNSPIAVPDVDLSRYGTGRGLRIGSTYEDILSIYGGKRAPQPRHSVLGYSAFALGHAVTTGHSIVKLPERVTIVIDNDRISSISIYIDEAGLF